MAPDNVFSITLIALVLLWLAGSAEYFALWIYNKKTNKKVSISFIKQMVLAIPVFGLITVTLIIPLSKVFYPMFGEPFGVIPIIGIIWCLSSLGCLVIFKIFNNKKSPQ